MAFQFLSNRIENDCLVVGKGEKIELVVDFVNRVVDWDKFRQENIKRDIP